MTAVWHAAGDVWHVLWAVCAVIGLIFVVILVAVTVLAVIFRPQPPRLPNPEPDHAVTRQRAPAAVDWTAWRHEIDGLTPADFDTPGGTK